MKRSYLCLSVLCAALLLRWPALAEPGVTQDAIVFGQVAAFEGPAGLLGQEFRDGLLAAFEEANRAGGVKGRKLKLVSEDDGYEPAKSIEAARILVGSGRIFALIGSIGTPTSAVIEPVAAEAGVPFLAPFTGAAFLREPFNPNVVNIRASYVQEAEAMAEWLTKDKGISRVATVYQDDAFGRAGQEALRAALAKRGIGLAAEGVFERNTLAIKSALLTIQAAKPEAIAFIGPYQPCAEFIRLARKLNLNATVLAPSFVGANALSRELGVLGDGVLVSQVVPYPEDGSLPFGARYRAALKAVKPSADAGFVSTEGYFAGRLVAAVLEKLPDEPARRDFLAAIFGSSFDLDGFKLNFAPGSNQGSNAVFLTVLKADGTFKVIAGPGSEGHSAQHLAK